MGPVASEGNNAGMESFFTLLQKNVLDRRWTTRTGLNWIIGSDAPITAAAGRSTWPLDPIKDEAIMTSQVATPPETNGHPSVQQPPLKADGE